MIKCAAGTAFLVRLRYRLANLIMTLEFHIILGGCAAVDSVTTTWTLAIAAAQVQAEKVRVLLTNYSKWCLTVPKPYFSDFGVDNFGTKLDQKGPTLPCRQPPVEILELSRQLKSANLAFLDGGIESTHFLML